MEQAAQIGKRRAMTTEVARYVRQQGHDDALEFALAIGLPSDYKNDVRAKKDVIDPSGDAHSVKSGQKKWQIFLYGLNRFESDDAFRLMNGIGGLLAECITAFPPTYAEYVADKVSVKERLRSPMRALAEKMKEKLRMRVFLNKSLFNGGEVNYLTVKHDGIFHVFRNNDVIDALSDTVEICNSTARRAGEVSDQKVLFRYDGTTLGEVEVRHDSILHYRQICFSIKKPKIMELLLARIPMNKKFNEKVLVYGSASKWFGRWET